MKKETYSIQSDFNDKKKRRPRSSAGERNYFCGCGKAYLSYPALYTHVKNKHDGTFPIGSNAKRKIPRQADDESEQLFHKDIDTFYNDLKEFILQIDNASAESEQILQWSQIEATFDKIFLKENLKELLEFKDSFQEMLKLKDDKENFSVVKDSLSIYQVLSYYLIQIHKYCSKGFFEEYMLLIFFLLVSLNNKGKMFLRKSQEQILQINLQDKKNFCQENKITIVAEIMNLFLAELFPLFLKDYHERNQYQFHFLGFEDENIKNLILMTKFLANWLFNFGFINYRLEINVDF